MPIIEVPLGDSYEDAPVPEGEYDLRIQDVKDGRNKKDTANQSMVMIKVDDGEYPNAATIFHYLTYPGEGDTEEQVRGKMRNLTRFLKLFSVAYEKKGFNSEDLPGCTARATLTQEEYEGNITNRLRLPRAE
jgi:hypothetical protein